MRDDSAHERLREYPVTFASIGVIHTLLTAGVVFGWASLLPVLREEGVSLSSSDFARIFTHGAIGNYMSSLPFGLLLDNWGPKKCGMLASILFAVGLILCSFALESTLCLDVGFTLLGFAGPAIQLPTLHLARLFPGEATEGGSGGAAFVMSAQAGAFDGGTVVLALFAAANRSMEMPSQQFFQFYLVVPLFTFITALLYWPNKILPDDLFGSGTEHDSSYVGRSPYLSPAASLPIPSTAQKEGLKDAPLSLILRRPQFYCLAIWVAVHILKLNFVVATINDQIDYAFDGDEKTADTLIRIFGAMLPFGFVVLPGVAYLLGKSPSMCFQLANIVGVVYGAVLTFAPGVAYFQILVVFVAVATSRQLVYSAVFHQTGDLFGFRNYGVILGLINVVVSSVSLAQGPLVEWAESREDYFEPNMVLLLGTIPLFGLVYWASTPPDADRLTKSRLKPPSAINVVNEDSFLLAPRLDQSPVARPRRYSDAFVLT